MLSFKITLFGCQGAGKTELLKQLQEKPSPFRELYRQTINYTATSVIQNMDNLSDKVNLIIYDAVDPVDSVLIPQTSLGIYFTSVRS